MKLHEKYRTNEYKFSLENFSIQKFGNDLCFNHSVVYLLVSEKSKQNKHKKSAPIQIYYLKIKWTPNSTK